MNCNTNYHSVKFFKYSKNSNVMWLEFTELQQESLVAPKVKQPAIHTILINSLAIIEKSVQIQ